MVSPDMEGPDPVKATNPDHPIKYKMKLRQCLLFYLIVPAIPVFLLVLGFLYLMDPPPVIPTSLPSIAQQQPPDDLIERLPHDLKPSLYIITLQTYLPYKQGVDFGRRNRGVDAYVLMSFYCRKETNKIILNAYDLIIDENKLRLHDQDTKEAIVVSLAEIRNETQVLEFVTEQPLLVGHNYSMKINYGARMLDPGNRGLFFASYQTGNETRHHMVSQMQPIYARRVFPCFDEPEFKAEFQIVVIHPQGTTAVSNTKLQSIRTLRDKNWVQSEFHPTPKMSTYLLAVAVTDYPFIETYYRDIRIRVYAQPNHINYTHHVLNILPKTLNYYENYFDIRYPLPKLDVYVVQELAVTAMENWGLITAKDDAVVFHETTSTINEKMMAEMTIFHEVAHMWFGNLITMRWWNDLWLNEGFATHMSSSAAKNLTVEIDNLECLGEIQKLLTMRSEDTANRPPLSSKIVRRSGVHSAFEGVTYHKGAAVLRQLETIVGADQFQRVLRDFILKHIYDNADSEDFIKSIIRSLGKSNPFGKHDVYASIKTWTHNKGYPLITVTRLNSTSVQLSQQCYTGIEIENQLNHTWTIPLFFKRVFTQTELDVVMLHGNENLILHNVAVLDPDYIGYNRIMYDSESMEKITRQLLKDHTVISARGRAKLMFDALSLFEAGRSDLKPVLKMVQYAKNESILFPLKVLSLIMDTIHFLFMGLPRFEQPLRVFWNSILAEPFRHHIAANLSYQRNFESQGKLLITKACIHNHPPCIDYVRSQFSKLKATCATKKLSDSCNFIIPGYRDVIYAMAFRHGTVEDFDFLFDKLLIETVPMEQVHISYGLSGTINETLIIKAFNYHSFNMTNPQKLYCQSFYNFYTLDVIQSYSMTVFKELIKRHKNARFALMCANIPGKILLNDENVKRFDDFIANNSDISPLFLRKWKKNNAVAHRDLAVQKRHAPMLAQYLNEFNQKYQKMTENNTLSYNPGIVG